MQPVDVDLQGFGGKIFGIQIIISRTIFLSYLIGLFAIAFLIPILYLLLMRRDEVKILMMKFGFSYTKNFKFRRLKKKLIFSDNKQYYVDKNLANFIK
jgi:high-affinity Fe2+/Pb2+ permease